MANLGVKCNVCECSHNDSAMNACKLACVEITHEKTSADAVATPHFCKSYAMK